MEFIYDRTEDDIRDRTPKAFLNASDLNRIETNCADIGRKIGASVVTGSWVIGDLPRTPDYRRILDNVSAIHSGYRINPDTPLVPLQPLNVYQKWNDIEKILFDVNSLYEEDNKNLDATSILGFGIIGKMILGKSEAFNSRYSYTGEIYAGDDIGEI